jgi:predicted DsbA family dithiol-disulfide isomerase
LVAAEIPFDSAKGRLSTSLGMTKREHSGQAAMRRLRRMGVIAGHAWNLALGPGTLNRMAITIDVVHDTVCPWCRIGKKHLDDALAHWEGEPPVIRWHPFLLNPSMPPEGRDFREYMASIKGDENIEPIILHVTRAGTQAGLAFRWDRVRKAPNTLLSHALIEAAPRELRGEVIDELHREYFERGGDIGDRNQLTTIARRFDIEPARLDDPALLDEIAGRADAARYQGITGVPFFIFDGQFSVGGAQPPSVLLAAIERAAQAAVTAE